MSELPRPHERSFGRLIAEAALQQPVPNMDVLSESKKGYGELLIDTTHPKFEETLVNIADYGIAGQAYYSRSNAATGQPVPGVPSNLYLRKSVVETLANINTALNNPAITGFFGGEVELYIEDALRSVSLQTRLHDELIPALLRTNHPSITDGDIEERIEDIIAVPSSDSLKPSPHATGGAFDVILRRKQTLLSYVEGARIEVGHVDGETSSRINPDYFERNEPRADHEHAAKRNRRAYYSIMTGSAFGVGTGFVNNPTEWWHWGRGDQLSEKVRGSSSAYYSIPPTTSR